MKCKECGAPIKKNETECSECSSTVKKGKPIIYNNKDVKELKLGLNVKDPITISKDNKDKQKQSLLFKALIAVAVLIMISGGYLIYLIVDTGKTKDSGGDETVVEVPKGYKRIGTKDHGYINIPESWIEEKNQDNQIIYYNEDEENLDSIIMSVADKTEAASSPEMIIEDLYKDAVDGGAKDINKDEVAIGDYKVHQMQVKIEDNTTYAWVFEDNNNKIHTIIILYNHTDNDLSQIIRSYKLEN